MPKTGSLPPRYLVEATLAAAPRAVFDEQSSGMPRRRQSTARCRICGVNEKLTREHVPPRAVGNAGTSRVHGIMDWLARESLDEITGGRQQQGGNWEYTLCGPCNNATGRYATEYACWAASAEQILMEVGTPFVFDAETVARVIRVTLPDAAAGSFVRQVLLMMMTASSEWDVAGLYPSLRDAVMSG